LRGRSRALVKWGGQKVGEYGLGWATRVATHKEKTVRRQRISLKNHTKRTVEGGEAAKMVAKRSKTNLRTNF